MATSVEGFVSIHINYATIGIQICLSTAIYSAFQRSQIDRRKTKVMFVTLHFVVFVVFLVHAISRSAEEYWLMSWPEDKDGFLYAISKTSATYDTIDKTSTVILVLLGNGMLLYRCFVVWSQRRWLLALPGLTYIATVPMAILSIISGTSVLSYISLGGLFADNTFIATWFILAVVTNVLSTGLITFRLIRAHRRLTKYLDRKQSEIYTGIVAILVESSLPFALFGIIASGTVAVYGDLFPALANVWYAFAALSPQFIIYRVVTEQAWARDLEKRATEIQLSRPLAFAPKPESTVMTDSA